MNRLRRTFSLALGITVLAAPLASRAQRSASNYIVLKPELPVEAQGKIEVLEFFWYGCIHCYELEPLLEAWLKKIPPDVQFRRVPAVFNERFARDAAIFYALEASGNLERLHRPLFDAIHRDGLKTTDGQALGQWLTKNGVDTRKFDEIGKSFTVQSKVRRAAQLSQAYNIEGTPAMAVQGRYTINTNAGHAGMLATVDSLVDQVRRAAPPK